jgi:hypothetical protein
MSLNPKRESRTRTEVPFWRGRYRPESRDLERTLWRVPGRQVGNPKGHTPGE